ncbi:Hypothetical predicted protein [Paramuricea clavata]|uniref:Uncharacterized protein n=1 Tax=Paramuricea clavata TaxID=317549 RepID=A0A7D9KIN0_PARCT|nr:Hypothetical predicted protein [Paramuricea clavata]
MAWPIGELPTKFFSLKSSRVCPGRGQLENCNFKANNSSKQISRKWASGASSSNGQVFQEMKGGCRAAAAGVRPAIEKEAQSKLLRIDVCPPKRSQSAEMRSDEFVVAVNDPTYRCQPPTDEFWVRAAATRKMA